MLLFSHFKLDTSCTKLYRDCEEAVIILCNLGLIITVKLNNFHLQLLYWKILDDFFAKQATFFILQIKVIFNYPISPKIY